MAGLVSIPAERQASPLCAQQGNANLGRLRADASSLLPPQLETRARLDATAAALGIVGESPALRGALETAFRAGQSDAPVLIEGESGTGKELFASLIHHASHRAQSPLVAINCGAIPEQLMEAELFGHVRGAFTGADRDSPGRIAAADGGTLFLDEVGELPLHLQVKLLRFLQSGELQRVGESKTRRVSVRLVAATNRDMNAMVRDGLFRDDFLYRIRVVAIRVPPLRERGQDVLLLARRFVEHFARIQKRTVGGLTPKAIDALLSHRFPGNVRELENAIHRAVVFAEGDQIDYEDLPQEVRERVDEKSTEQSIPRNAVELRLAKEQAASKIEKAFLISLLERASGNVTTAAQLASMNRSVLHQLLTRQGIMPHQFRSRSE